jgi:hypothetical protein
MFASNERLLANGIKLEYYRKRCGSHIFFDVFLSKSKLKKSATTPIQQIKI